jgi:Carboxypeptidase regulatory-like domain
MENLRRIYIGIVLTAAFIFLAIPVFAQLPTATILGNVKDSSGASVPGATVSARNVDTNFVRTVTTGDDGSYRLAELPVGNYELKAEHAGFQTVSQSGITLQVTQQAVINFTLQVGATQQQVVVTGEAPIVNTANATLGGVTNEASLKSLPLNGRNYIDLSLLQPGVNPDKNKQDQGTSFSVNGAPVRSNNFTLDGAILQNLVGRSPTAGESGDSLGLDGIKEYRVITSNFQAEYGMTMGSQMVMVSKSGTNQFHGDVFEYLRNSRLDAKNFFDQGKIPEFQRNDFGGSFGGPIRKDKTFFYAVYEGLRENLGTTNNNQVPSAGCHPPNATAANGYGAGAVITVAQCPDLQGFTVNGSPVNSVTLSQYTAPFLAIMPLPTTPFDPATMTLASSEFGGHTNTREDYGQIRVDQNFSENDTFFARYTIDNPIVAHESEDYSYFRYNTPARDQYITLAETHIFSPSVLNTVRFSFSRTNGSLMTNLVGLDQNGGLGPAIVSGTPTGIIDIGGVGGGAYSEFGTIDNGFPGSFKIQNIYTLSDDVNWIRGKHSFKFGVLLNRYNDALNSANSLPGALNFDSFGNFLLSQPSLVEFMPPFVPFNGQQFPVTENRFYVFNTIGMYAQDDWRATQRLTLNLGFRYEFMTTPHELNGRESRLVNDFTDSFTLGPIMKNNTLHNFSPRIGLAYDVFGNGKTAIRAGSGIYYDIGNIGSALGNTTIGAPPYSGLVDIFGTDVQSLWPVPLPFTPAILANPGTGGFTAQWMDYNFKAPYMIQYNVSVEQQLPWNMAIGVAYVGNHGVHLTTIREGNPIFPTSTGPCGDPASLCVSGIVPFWDTGAASYTPVNPNIGSDINVGTFSDSHYNGVQIVLTKRTSHGLEFNSAFTHGNVTDDTQGQENVRDCTNAGGLLGVYPLDPKATDYGPACFNVPNNWEFNVLYHFPNLGSGNSFLSKMASGWVVSSIVSVESGEPFPVVLGGNRSQSGVLQGQTDRVNINTPALLSKYPCTSQPGQTPAGSNPCAYTPVPYDPNTVITGTVNQWFNANMFSISPLSLSPNSEQPSCFLNPSDPNFPCPPNVIGQLGTSGRNILSGPPSRNWDFSVVKDTKLGFLGEAGMVEFRAEIFNILNHPIFAQPVAQAFAGDPGDLGMFSEAPAAGAGQITKTQATPRQIQFALRFEF